MTNAEALDRQYRPTDVGRAPSETRAAAPRHRTHPLWVRLFPIIFFVSYLTLTVLLFAFGPWPYAVESGTKLYTFITAAHIMLLLGYLSAFRKAGRGYSGSWPARKLVILSVVVGLPILYGTIVFRVDVSPGDLIGGAVTLGDAYQFSNATRSSETPIIEYVRFFVGPVLALVFPLGVFYWKSLSKLVRVLAVVYIVGNVGMFALMGTNKLIADTAILLPWLVLAGHISGRLKIRWTGKVAIAVGAAALLIGFAVFFTETVGSREGSFAVDSAYSRAGNVYADNDNFMIRNLSGQAKGGVLSLVSYLSHGYYALYLSLDKPFVPTFGVGNSIFLVRQAARLPGLKDLEDQPYPMRIEEDGWEAYGFWSTIYPWIASDVSFPGTLIVVFLIGRLFALCWLDTLHGTNPFAVAMFAQLLTMLYYFNANNQCLQSGEGFSAFSVLLILWLTTRRKPGVRRVAV